MKTHVLLLALLALIGSMALVEAAATPQTKVGDMSVAYTFQGLGNFGIDAPTMASVGTPTFNNNTGAVTVSSADVKGIEFRYFAMDRAALRLGLGFASESFTFPNSNAADTTVSQTMFGIAPAVEYHFLEKGPVTAYAGAKLTIATGSQEWKRPQAAPNQNSTSTTDLSATSFGIGGIFGTEYYLADSLSIGAEYDLMIGGLSTKSKVAGTSTDGPKSTGLELGQDVAVKINVHF